MTTKRIKQTSNVEAQSNDIDPSNKTKSKQSVTSNVSSQKQLIALAKKFSVDGALVSIEKQAPLEDRSFKRIKTNELRKQQNMEAIILAAIPYCSDSRMTNNTDQDWFNHFISLAENISNKTMQSLWAKILAGEIAQPGSFSFKTLQAFRSMSITEAKLFAKACSLALTDGRKKNIRIINGAYQVPSLFNFFNKQREQKLDLNAQGFGYADLLTLADNHLLFQQEAETAPVVRKEQIQLYSSGKAVTFTAKKSNCILMFYKFTPIGTELFQLIADDINTKYITALKEGLNENFAIE